MDLNISHGDITNEQEAGCSYSTEPSTIDLIWKSTVESTRKRSISHSSKKLWSFMNLQKPAVYRINRKFIKGSLDLNPSFQIFQSIYSKILLALEKINVAYQLGFKSTNGSQSSNISTNSNGSNSLNGSSSFNASSGNEKRKLGSTKRKRKSSGKNRFPES